MNPVCTFPAANSAWPAKLSKNRMFVFKPTIWNQEPDVRVRINYLKPKTECLCSDPLSETKNWMFCVQTHYLKPRTRCSCSNQLFETKNRMYCVQTKYLKPRTKFLYSNQLSETNVHVQTDYLKPRIACSCSNSLSETKNQMFVFKLTI